jgi:anaerobic selenocysteine-containing dehydrogenase
MKKIFNKYIAMLKKLTSSQGYASNPGAYKWKKVRRRYGGKKETLFGICGACMQKDCATLVRLEDGIVVRIEGNPDAPPNFGTLCPRGNSEIMGFYNPYRVKTPMVRTNPEKGLDVDPMWKEVEWDEALDLVADKLKKVREKDPRGFVQLEGFGNSDAILRAPFLHAFGSPNEVGSHGVLCTVHYASALVQAGFPVGIVDLEYCNYHITLGRSLGPNFATASAVRKFANALERGMKLVVVDPRCSFEATKGEWVPIRPGTDLAFLLSMAHVMLHEINVFDEWFLKNRTNSPYLIGPDGYYYRDPESGKPMMWDAAEDRAKPFDHDFQEIALSGRYTVNAVECVTGFDIVREQFAGYTPEWAEEKCTVPAETIRKIAGEFVAHAQIGSTIEIDGFTFPFRPVSLNTERNVTNHRGGTYADLTGKLINMLVGCIEVPGGCLVNGPRGPLLAPGDDGVVKPYGESIGHPFKFPPDHIDCKEYYPHSHTTPQLAVKAILNPEMYHHDYKVEAWMTIGANPFRKVAQPQTFVEAFKKIPFHVCFSLHMDEPAIMADVLLPEHGFLERARVEVFHMQHQTTNNDVTGLQMIQLREPVPALFNTRHTDDILMDLAERIGILYGEGGVYDELNKTIDFRSGHDGMNLAGTGYELDLNRRHALKEIFDHQIRSWRHNHKGLGYKDVRKTGYIEHRVPKYEFYNYYYFPDNKTRHPFYFNHLKFKGDELRKNLKNAGISFPGIDNDEYIFECYEPVPHWVENSECNAPEDYDLWAMNWRTPYHSNDISNVIGNPWLAEFRRKDPTDGVININTDVAEKKGLKEGDKVFVESRYGRIEGSIHVSELFHPDAVGISGCYGLGTVKSNPLNRTGPHFNSLLPIDDKTYDSVSAGIEIAPRVRIYKQEKSK